MPTPYVFHALHFGILENLDDISDSAQPVKEQPGCSLTVLPAQYELAVILSISASLPCGRIADCDIVPVSRTSDHVLEVGRAEMAS